MRSVDHDLEHDGRFADMPRLNVDPQVGKGLEEPLVEAANLIAAGIVKRPWLIVVARRGAERMHNAFEIVLVLLSDVLFDQLQSCVHRDGLQFHLATFYTVTA